MMDYSSGPHVLSFSQPNNRDFGTVNSEDGFPASYLGSPSTSFMDIFPSERITRFYSPAAPEYITQRICIAFDTFLVQYRENQSLNTVGFSTVDKRKCSMQGEVCVQLVGGEHLCLVTFRKSRVINQYNIIGRSIRMEKILSCNKRVVDGLSMPIKSDLRIH